MLFPLLMTSARPTERPVEDSLCFPSSLSPLSLLPHRMFRCCPRSRTQYFANRFLLDTVKVARSVSEMGTVPEVYARLVSTWSGDNLPTRLGEIWPPLLKAS